MSPFIANFESPTALVTLVVNFSFVTTFVSAFSSSPLSNVYFLVPALITKSPLFSVVIELMFVRALFSVYFIPLVSLLALTLSSPKKLSVPLAPIVAPAVAPSALAVNSCSAFKSLMPRAVFHLFLFASSVKFEASRFAFLDKSVEVT